MIAFLQNGSTKSAAEAGYAPKAAQESQSLEWEAKLLAGQHMACVLLKKAMKIPTTVVSCVWRESCWGFAQRLWYSACGGRVIGDSPNDCGIVRVEGELLGIHPTTAYHCILSFDLDFVAKGAPRPFTAVLQLFSLVGAARICRMRKPSVQSN